MTPTSIGAVWARVLKNRRVEADRNADLVERGVYPVPIGAAYKHDEADRDPFMDAVSNTMVCLCIVLAAGVLVVQVVRWIMHVVVVR